MQSLLRLAEWVEDWKHLTRRDGWEAARGQVLRDMLSLPYRRIHYLFLSRSLGNPVPNSAPKISLEIRPFEHADLKYVRNDHLPSEAHLCERRMQRGHFGFVACNKGQFAGYAWACTDLSLENVSLPFLEGDILFNDAFTAAAYRRKGVLRALISFRVSLFRDQGYRRAVSYADIKNTAPVSSWVKIGGQVAGNIYYRRILNWRQSRYQP